MGEENSATLVENQSPVNPASDYKKSTKPIMEKRRRARINASLLELKALLLDVMRQEGVRHQKMEKADILEMAVKHLRQIQKGVGLSTDRFILNKYNAGFNECANEVSRYLNDTDNVEIDVRTKILDHLMNVVQGGDNDDMTQLPGPTLSPVAPVHSPASSVSPISLPASPVKITGNFVQTLNPMPTATQVLNSGQMATLQQMQVIVRQGASPAVVQYATPSTTVVPTLNSPSQVLGGLQLIPVQLANGDVVFAIPKQAVPQQQSPVAHEKQPEADEATVKELPKMAPSAPSPPSPVTLHRNPSPVNQQQHTITHQHHSPSIQQHHTVHTPSSQQLSPSGHHITSNQYQSPIETTPNHTTIHRPTAHQSVIKHTSPKMHCVDQNNNDFRVQSHYGENLTLKKETELSKPDISPERQVPKPDFFSERQEKIDLGRYQSFMDYHRKMEPLKFNNESLPQTQSLKKQTLSRHGLVYRTVRESRFQPYSTQHHYYPDVVGLQQSMWRPW